MVRSEDSEKIPADDFFGSYKPHNVSKLSAQAFFAFLGNPEHASDAFSADFASFRFSRDRHSYLLT